MRECARRIRGEADHEELETILALFAMIKLDPITVERIVRWHVTILEKSPIYQEILAKGVQQGLEQGRKQELRRNIRRLLARRFGKGEAVRISAARLEACSLAVLEMLFDEAVVTPDVAAFEAVLAGVEL